VGGDCPIAATCGGETAALRGRAALTASGAVPRFTSDAAVHLA